MILAKEVLSHGQTHLQRYNNINPTMIRLLRSFDEASHTYLGYAITLEGEIDNINTTFSVGIGKAAHAKHQFKVNDVIFRECVPVPDPDTEPTEYYKVSKLKFITRSTANIT